MSPLTPGSEKIVSSAELLARLEARRASGERVVFTNGVFDLLHVGHVRYLERARGLGDLLVVAVNSDASVRANRGPDRPIVPQEQRAEVLAALRAVDYVVLFEEPTAVALVEQVRPEVYVKGGDYSVESLPEAQAVLRQSGAVELAALEPGLSTSALIREIVRRFGPSEAGP